MKDLTIVGQGAIGSVLAAKCQQSEQKFNVLPRIEPAHAINYQNAHCNFSFTPSSVTAQTLAKTDAIVLPIKAYQVAETIESIANYVEHQTIVLLHNGMGTIELVSKRLPKVPLLVATTSYGAYKPTDNSVIETGQGKTHLGWINQADSATDLWLRQLFDSALPPCIWHHDIFPALWTKLAINAVINPITAIKQIKNGQLADNCYRPQIVGVCREISLIMNKSGYPMDTDYLVAQVFEVIEKTAENFSSMHQDVKFHKQTEIEYVNGYVHNLGKSLAIPTPENSKLLATIKSIENNY